MPEPGTCVLCGCREDRPCLGGVVFASTFEANHVHRLVLDEEVLAPGEACAWIDEGETVCTAHTREELAALVQGTLDELGLIREAEEDTFRG